MKAKIPDSALLVIERLEACGHAAFLVGGAVRDILMGNLPGDVDITTSAFPLEVTKLFSDVLPTGISHGTVTVRDFGAPVEVTTFRGDGEYLDRRRPSSVRFVPAVEEDLSRRDFTINAIAMARDGSVTDPFGGRFDIWKKIIRTVGEPGRRFSEDALRMYRAFRFAACLGFEISDSVYAAIIENAPLHREISAERVLTELLKILESPSPEYAGELVLTGLFDRFLDLNPAAPPDTSRLLLLPKNKSFRLGGFLALLYDCGAVFSLRNIIDRLKLPSKLTKTLKSAADRFESPPYSRILWKEFAAEAGDDSARMLAAMLRASGRDEGAPDTFEEIVNSGECRGLPWLSVSGKDLIKLGFEGKAVGRELNELLFYVIQNPEENEKEKLLKLSRCHFKDLR